MRPWSPFNTINVIRVTSGAYLLLDGQIEPSKGSQDAEMMINVRSEWSKHNGQFGLCYLISVNIFASQFASFSPFSRGSGGFVGGLLFSRACWFFDCMVDQAHSSHSTQNGQQYIIRSGPAELVGIRVSIPLDSPRSGWLLILVPTVIRSRSDDTTKSRAAFRWYRDIESDDIYPQSSSVWGSVWWSASRYVRCFVESAGGLVNCPITTNSARSMMYLKSLVVATIVCLEWFGGTNWGGQSRRRIELKLGRQSPNIYSGSMSVVLVSASPVALENRDPWPLKINSN